MATKFVTLLNVANVSPSMFAYHFMSRASGPVIKNLFAIFDGVLDILVQRFDDDLCQTYDEYDCAVIAKRIQDAMQDFK